MALHYGAAGSAVQAFATRTTSVVDADGNRILYYQSAGAADSDEVLSDVYNLLYPE